MKVIEEQWKQIQSYPDHQISNYGNVKSLRKGCHYNEILTGTITKKGYRTVNLTDKDNKQHHVFVHRLVALHFIPNPENKLQVDHIDKNRLNNHITNLRWVNNSENGRNRKDNSIIIRFPDNKIYDSFAEAAEDLGCNDSTQIIDCCNGKAKSVKNYYFEYYDPQKTYPIFNQNKIFTNKKAVINLTTGDIYESINEAKRQTGINNGNISLCCLNKRKTAGGYKWAYLNEEDRIYNDKND